MTELLQFAILGLGVSAVYVLLGQGLVLVYRGSGVVNFAHGSMALVGAFVYVDLLEHGWSALPAAVVSMIFNLLLGAGIHLLVMRPLRTSSPLIRVIATLGILIVLQAAVTLRYGPEPRSVAGFLPQQTVSVLGADVPVDRLWLLAIAVGVTTMLWLMSKYTLIGLAAEAVAENRRAAASLAWSPDVVATMNWGLGGALAALAGILVVPLTGLQITTLTGLVIAAMATALLASFRSFWLVLAGGIGLGIVQSEVGYFVSGQGWSTAAPFLLIMLVMIVRGRSLPLRGSEVEHRPAVGSGLLRPRVILPLLMVTGVLALFVLDANGNAVLITTFIIGTMLLSIILLTGYAGQLSLAQFTLGGIGAWFSGRSVAALGWPFEIALVAGVGGAMLVGSIFALPALRTRGVNLAVVTLGLGIAIHAVWLSNGRWTGGDAGTMVGPQTFLGVSVDPILSPGSYAVFTCVCFTIVAFVVANIRRSGSGRQLLAVRSNERAAASLGISVLSAKVFAFVVSAGIAGLAGTLLAFNGYAITYDTTFDPFQSITAVTLAVLGGVGYIAGALLGATLADGGLGTFINNHLFANFDPQWLLLVSGLLFIVILILNPNGLVSGNLDMARKVRSKFARSTSRVEAVTVPEPDSAGDVYTVTPQNLKVEGLTVRYGAVVAVDALNLEVRPGEVVGLIGSNGAGKTSVIDAITGFAPASGAVTLGEQRIDGWPAHRRARAGLSRTFQSLELFGDVSVTENLLTAGRTGNWLSTLRDLVYPRQSNLKPAAIAAVRSLGLESELNARADGLPFGRRRLVAIARALAMRPSILLLDEPAAGLDENETEELSRLITRLASETGVGILLVEHDVALIMKVCDRITVLNFGKSIACGTADEIASNEVVRDAYLGSPVTATNEQ